MGTRKSISFSNLREILLLVPGVQFPECPASFQGHDWGCHLTRLFEPLPTVPAINAPASSKKRGWLPVLTALFLVSYGLMTMLIVEQGRTIESQRVLIRELFRDSAELSATKAKAREEAQSLSAQTQAPEIQNPASQNPPSQYPLTQHSSTQHPSTQAPNIQAPSSQAAPQQQRAQNQSAKQKPDFKMPSKPEADLVDDVHTLITI